MPGKASSYAQQLAAMAEAVCRYYLPNGRRTGHYWIVGDVSGSPGRSLYVSLSGHRAGHWTDGATAQHGDLLDLIGLNQGHRRLRETLEEARLFLKEPVHAPSYAPAPKPAQRNSTASAEKLFGLSKPVPGTLAETYLRSRGITASLALPALRFHPACFYRPDNCMARETWPAMIAAVTDLEGKLTGLHRTYLARDGGGKAPMDEPRRAMGNLLGFAVRFGEAADVLAAGEGIETVLSLLSLVPALPMAAGLSSAHLAAMLFPPQLRRLYILRDNDAAGGQAVEALMKRCTGHGIELRVLEPLAKDLNVDLRAGPAPAVKGRLIAQLEPEDRARFG